MRIFCIKDSPLLIRHQSCSTPKTWNITRAPSDRLRVYAYMHIVIIKFHHQRHIAHAESITQSTSQWITCCRFFSKRLSSLKKRKICILIWARIYELEWKIKNNWGSCGHWWCLCIGYARYANGHAGRETDDGCARCDDARSAAGRTAGNTRSTDTAAAPAPAATPRQPGAAWPLRCTLSWLGIPPQLDRHL